jgi:hypothetical protein
MKKSYEDSVNELISMAALRRGFAINEHAVCALLDYALQLDHQRITLAKQAARMSELFSKVSREVMRGQHPQYDFSAAMRFEAEQATYTGCIRFLRTLVRTHLGPESLAMFDGEMQAAA